MWIQKDSIYKFSESYQEILVQTMDKPSSRFGFGYCFGVGPYQFCSDDNPTTLSILPWSYLILFDNHIWTLSSQS